MHSGSFLFYRLRLERLAVNLPAVQRQHGLEQFLGSAVLADVMGPGEDIAVPLSAASEVLICEECAMPEIHILAERIENRGSEVPR